MAEATQPTGPAQPAANPAGATSTFDAAVEAELAAMEGVDEEEPPPEGAEGAERPEGEEGEQPEEADEQEAQQLQLGEGDVEYTTEGGKKYAIPKEVADNMLRQQDYTRNMQHLGEIARAQETAGRQLSELYQTGEYLSAHRVRLAQIDAGEREIHAYLEANPDLSQSDSAEFNRLVGQLNLLQHHRNKSQQAMDTAQQQHATFEAQQTAQRVARVMPVFQQMGVNMGHLKAVEGHCKAMGLSNEAISFLNEAREPGAIMMALESMAYRALIAQKSKATTQVTKAKSSGVLRPGASSVGGQPKGNGTQYARRLEATGSVKDAVANEMAIAARAAKGQRLR